MCKITCEVKIENFIFFGRERTKRKMSALNSPIIIVCSEGAKSSEEIINSKWEIVDLSRSACIGPECCHKCTASKITKRITKSNWHLSC